MFRYNAEVKTLINDGATKIGPHFQTRMPTYSSRLVFQQKYSSDMKNTAILSTAVGTKYW